MVFVGMASEAASTNSWNVKPWPEPVDTRVLLQEISAKISKYIIMHPEAVTATALWTMTAWAHRDALPHSGRNFCRTRFRQEHPPWCSTLSRTETICQRRTDWSQRIPYS